MEAGLDLKAHRCNLLPPKNSYLGCDNSYLLCEKGMEAEGQWGRDPQGPGLPTWGEREGGGEEQD